MHTKFTHLELSQRAASFLMKNGFGIAFDERLATISDEDEQLDALGFNTGVSCLVEVKVDRVDFLQNNDKALPGDTTGLGDWRFYLAPEGVIKPEELPPGWGLLQPTEVGLKIVTGWPEKGKWMENKPFNGNKQAECDYMYSALTRLKAIDYFGAIYRDAKGKERQMPLQAAS